MSNTMAQSPGKGDDKIAGTASAQEVPYVPGRPVPPSANPISEDAQPSEGARTHHATTEQLHASAAGTAGAAHESRAQHGDSRPLTPPAHASPTSATLTSAAKSSEATPSRLSAAGTPARGASPSVSPVSDPSSFISDFLRWTATPGVLDHFRIGTNSAVTLREVENAAQVQLSEWRRQTAVMARLRSDIAQDNPDSSTHNRSILETWVQWCAGVSIPAFPIYPPALALALRLIRTPNLRTYVIAVLDTFRSYQFTRLANNAQAYTIWAIFSGDPKICLQDFGCLAEIAALDYQPRPIDAQLDGLSINFRDLAIMLNPTWLRMMNPDFDYLPPRLKSMRLSTAASNTTTAPPPSATSVSSTPAPSSVANLPSQDPQPAQPAQPAVAQEAVESSLFSDTTSDTLQAQEQGEGSEAARGPGHEAAVAQVSSQTTEKAPAPVPATATVPAPAPASASAPEPTQVTAEAPAPAPASVTDTPPQDKTDHITVLTPALDAPPVADSASAAPPVADPAPAAPPIADPIANAVAAAVARATAGSAETTPAAATAPATTSSREQTATATITIDDSPGPESDTKSEARTAAHAPPNVSSRPMERGIAPSASGSGGYGSGDLQDHKTLARLRLKWNRYTQLVDMDSTTPFVRLLPSESERKKSPRVTKLEDTFYELATQVFDILKHKKKVKFTQEMLQAAANEAAGVDLRPPPPPVSRSSAQSTVSRPSQNRTRAVRVHTPFANYIPSLMNQNVYRGTNLTSLMSPPSITRHPGVLFVIQPALRQSPYRVIELRYLISEQDPLKPLSFQEAQDAYRKHHTHLFKHALDHSLLVPSTRFLHNTPPIEKRERPSTLPPLDPSYHLMTDSEAQTGLPVASHTSNVIDLTFEDDSETEALARSQPVVSVSDQKDDVAASDQREKVEAPHQETEADSHVAQNDQKGLIATHLAQPSGNGHMRPSASLEESPQGGLSDTLTPTQGVDGQVSAAEGGEEVNKEVAQALTNAPAPAPTLVPAAASLSAPTPQKRTRDDDSDDDDIIIIDDDVPSKRSKKEAPHDLTAENSTGNSTENHKNTPEKMKDSDSTRQNFYLALQQGQVIKKQDEHIHSATSQTQLLGLPMDLQHDPARLPYEVELHEQSRLERERHSPLDRATTHPVQHASQNDALPTSMGRFYTPYNTDKSLGRQELASLSDASHALSAQAVQVSVASNVLTAPHAPVAPANSDTLNAVTPKETPPVRTVVLTTASHENDGANTATGMTLQAHPLHKILASPDSLGPGNQETSDILGSALLSHEQLVGLAGKEDEHTTSDEEHVLVTPPASMSPLFSITSDSEDGTKDVDTVVRESVQQDARAANLTDANPDLGLPEPALTSMSGSSGLPVLQMDNSGDKGSNGTENGTENGVENGVENGANNRDDGQEHPASPQPGRPVFRDQGQGRDDQDRDDRSESRPSGYSSDAPMQLETPSPEDSEDETNLEKAPPSNSAAVPNPVRQKKDTVSDSEYFSSSERHNGGLFDVERESVEREGPSETVTTRESKGPGAKNGIKEDVEVSPTDEYSSTAGDDIARLLFGPESSIEYEPVPPPASPPPLTEASNSGESTPKHVPLKFNIAIPVAFKLGLGKRRVSATRDHSDATADVDAEESERLPKRPRTESPQAVPAGVTWSQYGLKECLEDGLARIPKLSLRPSLPFSPLVDGFLYGDSSA